MADSAAAALAHAARACADPGGTIRHWKALTGRKVVGCFPFGIAEEVISAAGMLPVTVWGDEFPEPPADSDDPNSLTALESGIVRSIRRGLWRDIDAWAIPASRAVFPHCAELLMLAGDDRPGFRYDRQGGELLDMLDLVEAFIEWAEQVAGGTVTDGALEKAVRDHNDDRRAFGALVAKMAGAPGFFSAVEIRDLARSGMILPKSAHRRILEGALARKIPWNASPTTRVSVQGAVLPPDAARELDGTGAAVVADRTASGGLYYDLLADEGGDAAVSLARRTEGSGRIAAAAGIDFPVQYSVIVV